MSEKALSMKEYIDEAEAALLHTYNRYQVVLDKGDGVYPYDMEGKKYLDFCAGIAVFALGYNNREYNDALKAQIDKIIHTSNYYYNVPAVEAAVKMKKVSGMDRVFFTNSGAEAIEGALKACLLYTSDMAMVYSQVPCKAAGVFTSNVVKAAPVVWDREKINTSPYIQAVVVNSGIANACTGRQGYAYCQETADAAAGALQIPGDCVLSLIHI